MRKVIPKEIELGEIAVNDIEIDAKSRDDIPQILWGLQYLYEKKEVREAIFTAIEKLIPENIDKNNGRPGLCLWRILVLGMLRVNLNWNYDRLQEMANNHKIIRKFLGHHAHDDHYYHLQTLKDNIRLFTPEILCEINQTIVSAGHKLLKKKQSETLRCRCDSFVVKTNVHFPTDINLLWDAVRKAIDLTYKLCDKHGITSWRQFEYNLKIIKRSYRLVQKAKKARSKDAKQKQKVSDGIMQAHQSYTDLTSTYFAKVMQTIEYAEKNYQLSLLDLVLIKNIKKFVKHGERQIDQIIRRVINEEKIPHNEKVFSLFEPHTEWISKGKLGVPVELGLKVCIVEDQNQFILHHRVMIQEVDSDITVLMAQETMEKFENLHSMSYDRGFYSGKNRSDLQEILEKVSLPKRGKHSQKDKEIEASEDYKKAKQKHSAVESAINALDVHGLDRCPDRGLIGFERYVALAIVARNIQRIGAILQRKKQRKSLLRQQREQRVLSLGEQIKKVA